jgi:hypothetical protein
MPKESREYYENVISQNRRRIVDLNNEISDLKKIKSNYVDYLAQVVEQYREEYPRVKKN